MMRSHSVASGSIPLAMAKQENSLAGYISRLGRQLSAALPRARQVKGERAVHQARVTTRRLGSAIDLVQPWLKKSTHKKMQQSLRQLRRNLGRLRDTDVMLARLEQYRSEHPMAVGWLEIHLQERRGKALKKLGRQPSAPTSGQWRDRELQLALAAASQLRIRGALSAAVRRSYDEFCHSADLLANEASNGQCAVDVHALRISGKQARYTLEIAGELGAPLPEGVGRQFKQIQDTLGAWHDYVVLAQRAMKLSARHELAIENTALFAAVIKLVSAVTTDAAAAIEEFKGSWKSTREEISPAVRQLCIAELPKRRPGKVTA